MKPRFSPRFIVFMAFLGTPWLRANPTGGAVAAGGADIAGQGTSTVTINQSTNSAIINWQTFSIGSGELTKFIQPSSSSATLNRVLGGQTSFINGTLSANGQIYLLNGNGIVVGPGGVINTAGFTGSTRDISDSDFLSGNLHFVGSSDAGVKNLGTITALGGDVVLIGKTVNNRGTINATGTAGLVAGDDVYLAQKNADGSTITVNPVSAPTAAGGKIGVNNTGVINASSAELKAANGNIYALAIQNKGVVRATTLTQQGGHIYLTSDSGTIVNSGTLDASATAAGGQGGTVLVKSTTGQVVHSGKILARGGQGGVGGNAEISGPQFSFTGTVDLTSPGGTTGNLLLDPASLTVVAGNGGSVNVISEGNDQNGASGTTIGATLVDNTLNSANLTLKADTSITIASDILWTSVNTLTLSTNTTGSSIAINAAITGTAGGLTIHTAGVADPISATGAVNVANFILQHGAWVQNVVPNTQTGASQLPVFIASNDFEIQGGTFLRTSGGDGSSTPYQFVDIYGVQGLNGFLSSNANLGPNSSTSTTIDASSTLTWNGGAGFVPIGSTENPYQGTFGSTGGTINNLTISRPDASDAVGLFSVIGTSGSVYYVAINNASITGNNNVGAIAGTNLGLIYNASSNNGTVNGNTNVGGIAGENDGTLDYEFTENVTITGVTDVGGLTGLNTSTIEGGFDDNNVNGVTAVGGIAGENDSTIDSATNYFSVNGTVQVGGIVGLNTVGATVSNSNNGATVTGSDTDSVQSSGVGGLVGENDGTLSDSYNTGSVSGDINVGGMVGFNAATGTITGAPSSSTSSGSFNQGSVSGSQSELEVDTQDQDIGGVVGLNNGLVLDSYNTGTVTGNTNVGGIAGENQGPPPGGGGDEGGGGGGLGDSIVEDNIDTPNVGIIQTSYNSGTVQSDFTGSASNIGGIAGLNDAGSLVTTCYNVGSIGDNNSNAVGGIVGNNSGTVTTTYNSGAVMGATPVFPLPSTAAGLVGVNNIDDHGNSGVLENSYWDVTTSGQSLATNNVIGATVSNVVPLNAPDGGTTPYLASSYSNFWGESGSPTLVANTNGVDEFGISPDPGGGPAWYIINGQTRPMLAMEQSLNIQNAHQLQLMAVNLAGDYSISLFIDASGTSNASEIWNSSGFAPIGTDIGDGSHVFTGGLNGENNTIDSLFINRPGTSDVGLFGYNAGDGQFNGETGQSNLITSVFLTNVNITGNSNVGGISGDNVGTIEFCQVGNSDDESILTGNGSNVGGIVGLNGTSGEGPAGLVTMDINFAPVQGGGESSNIGGIVGFNQVTGTVTQSINNGSVGSGSESNVGGLVGDNRGQVDDSYATNNASVDGSSNVGGLIGLNEETGVLETSYSTTSSISGGEDEEVSSTGVLVGTNNGTVQHVYWQTGEFELPGIGDDEGTSIDVAGYSSSQLTNMQNFAQGASPGLWDFSPQTNSGGGIWGVNVYNSSGIVNNGLPVLQWQTPVAVEVGLASNTVTYGSSPQYVATGNGSSSLTTEVNSPNGPTITISNPDDINAGSTHQVTFSGNPIFGGYNVEYVNGVITYSGGQQVGVTPGYTVVPAPLTISANNVSIASGQTPSFTATYNGFVLGQGPSALSGTLGFTVNPTPAVAVGNYVINLAGLNSNNYAITYVPGTLSIGGTPMGGENQPTTTTTTELTGVNNGFGGDPSDGLTPLYFMIIPTSFGLGGEFVGAINNKGNPSDYIYISSTAGLPALSRLVTPGTGIVIMGNGFVTAGHGIPPAALTALHSVLSPVVYHQLLALIYAHP